MSTSALLYARQKSYTITISMIENSHRLTEQHLHP